MPDLKKATDLMLKEALLKANLPPRKGNKGVEFMSGIGRNLETIAQFVEEIDSVEMIKGLSDRQL